MMIPQRYKQYAQDVVSGKIAASKYIMLACKRYLDWFNDPTKYFDADKIQRIEDFLQHISHFEGEFNGVTFANSLLDWQLWCLCNIFGWYRADDHSKRIVRNVFMLISRKNGKALSIDTDIPTPQGYKKMRDIHVGDYVFDRFGKPTKVTYESPVFENHDCYEMKFQNGETLIADADHLWQVKCSHKDIKVLTTEDLYKRKYKRSRKDGKGTEYLYRVPKSSAVYYPTKELPIDPYVLGLWLGDGHKKGAAFSSTLKDDDYKIYDYVAQIYGDYKITHDRRNYNTITVRFPNTIFSQKLIECGLKFNKHIPQEYLTASIEQRLALLQGLMDTDGYCSNKHGQCEIQQKNEKVAEGIIEIARSLGFIVTVHKKMSMCNGKECGYVTRITFHADKQLPPFRMKRKYDRLPDMLGERSEWNSILSIEPCESVHTKCIQVDNDEHLYLCGRCYTVTHNTGLSAAIMLADMIIGGEAGYEGYLVANNREQAKVAFKFIKGFCCSIDPKHRHLKVYRDYITYDKTNSRIKVLSSDAMGNDGYNPSSFIWDETAAAKDFSNFNILKSGQAMRKNPLSISISSAGFLLDGYPCYEQCKIGQRVLQGELTDDSTFYAIYQLDEEDDYTDEKNWVKACPSYPNIVQRDYMEERVREAQQNTAKMVDVKTKNFNIWCSSSNVWIPTAVLAKCHQVIDLEKLRSEPCYVGFDLSSTRDLTALTVMFPPNPYRTYMPDKFLFKNYCWIPQDAVRNSEQSTLYQWFIENGFAEMTAGNSVDYDAVFNKLKEIASMFTLVKVSYDQWNASMMVQRCIGEGFPMEPFHQGLGSFNRPTKSLEILVFNQQCCFDCNQLIMWMFGHAELKIDHMNNVKPIKANDDKKNKIDCIIAMLEALGGYLLDYVANNMNVVNLNF